MSYREHGTQQPTRSVLVYRFVTGIFLAIGLFVCSSPALAALVLQVNPGNMTVSVGGTDEDGTLFPLVTSGEGLGTWGFGTILGGFNILQLSSGITAGDPPAVLDFSLRVSAAGNGITFELLVEPYTANQLVTLTGTGSPFSYASFSPENKAFLESQIGQVLPVSPGGDFNSIQISQVPTPSAVLLMGTGLMGLIGWRWWSAKKYV